MNKRKLHKDHQSSSSSKRPHGENPSTTKPKDIWQSDQIVAELEKVFQSHGKASDAAAMKKYMRGQFEFFGVKSVQGRELCKEVFSAKDKDLPNSELRRFVLMLWEKPQRELQNKAVEFLDKHKKKLCQEAKEFDENMELFKTLVVTKSWWDTVDMVASKLVGHLVQTHPNKGVPVMEDWIKSENMWLRRTAILHQLSYKENTNSNLLFQFSLSRCDEEEFFIRKAIGWGLRQYAHTQPDKVKQFLLKNKDSLSKLSFNEASKHLKMAKK